MIKKLDDSVFSNNDIVFVKENFVNVRFSSDKMDVLSVDLNDVNLDNVIFDEDDLETIIHVRLMSWCNGFKQQKVFKK